MSKPYGPDGNCVYCHRHSCDNGDIICNERQARESEDDAALTLMLQAHKRSQNVPRLSTVRDGF